MEICETSINGLIIIKPKIFEDERGIFIKTFTDSFFKENNLNISIKESYYSISQKNVIRGMHFQTPPYEHTKIVYVPNGEILDVVLDIRESSPTYGKFFSSILSNKNGYVLVIPKGLAHGFKSLKDNTNVTYMQTSVYSPSHDKGIHYNSFGFDWECKNPKVSSRDLIFENFNSFHSPFLYQGKK